MYQNNFVVDAHYLSHVLLIPILAQTVEEAGLTLTNLLGELQRVAHTLTKKKILELYIYT